VELALLEFLPYTLPKKGDKTMARPRSEKPKKKVTITLEPEVVEALGPLQAKMEADAYGALAGADLETYYGPVRYTRSTVVQMAILLMCQKHDVKVRWEHDMAGDLTTGEVVEIPEGAEVGGEDEA